MSESKPSSRRPPTPEQAAAISRRGSSVAVSSGAGCGKTSVLTARFLASLDDGVDLASLVAVTFTDKAASELRGRIRAECRRRVRDSPDPRWRSVLRGLEAGRIGTFHTFCNDLLRRFPVEAGVAPDFDVLDAQIAPTVRDDALADCFRRWLAEDDDDFRELAIEFGLEPIRESLRDLLGRRARGAIDQWASVTPEQLLRAWRNAWEDGERARIVCDHLERPVSDCLAFLRDDLDWGSGKAAEKRALLLQFLPLLVAPGHDPSDAELLECREIAKVQGLQAKQWPSAEAHRLAGELFKRVRDSIDSFLKATNWDESLTLRAAEHGARFARLAVVAAKRYRQLEHALEQLDFDDLLQRTQQLLEAGSVEVVDPIVGESELLMVDEFQDTDPTQAAILRRLGGAETELGKVFLVGDPKQSIYRFRGALPGIFDDFRRELPEDARLSLTTNFRSVPGVLHFVNALFLGTPLDPDGSASLRPGVSVVSGPEPLSAPPPPVEFLWAYDEAKLGGKPSIDVRRRAEGRRIARLLSDRLRDGWPIWDVKQSVWRLARPGDVAILFRSVKTAAPYEDALTEVGLNFHTVGGSAFYAQQEVQDLINLLRCLEDPLDPLALAGVLRSPFFCLTDDALYWLSAAGAGGAVPPIRLGLDRCDHVPQLSRRDRRRSIRARALLERWRSRKDRVPVAALLSSALDESGYEAALLAEPNGPRRRANVRKLVQLARRYDRAGFALADFASRLANDLRQMTDEDQAATTTEGDLAVQLLTTHKAKGLEFPIVVLAELGKVSNDRPASLLLDPDLGPLAEPDRHIQTESDDGARGGDDPRSLGGLIRRAREKRADRAEALRVFYVAATRAQNHLILSSTHDAPTSASSNAPALEILARRFDPSTGSLVATLPDGFPAPVIGVVDPPDAVSGPLSSTGGAPRVEARLRLARRLSRRDVGHEADPPRVATSPSLLNLDLSPDRTDLAARIDRFFWELLRHARLGDQAGLDELARSLGRRMVPAASGWVARRALQRLAAYTSTTLFSSLGGRAADGRAMAFTHLHHGASGSSVLLTGTLDGLSRHDRGEVTAAVVARPDVPIAWERLRLLAGSRAMLGPSPRNWTGWVVELGPPLVLKNVERCDDAAIEAAVRDAIASALPSDDPPG